MIEDERIDNGQGFDWGRTSSDYAKYRDIYPDGFYEKIAGLGLCVKGQKVLDIGTGTGVLPRNMCKYGACFTGADIAQNQIDMARRLSQRLNINYVVSSAENLDFPDNTFDVITACQCFMYFDTTKVVPKIHRMLKRGGRLAVLFMSWLPEESEIAEKSEQLILKYNPLWTGGGMKRFAPAIPDWAHGLFLTEHNIAYDIEVPFTRESWNGRIRACRGVGASLSGEQVAAFDKEHTEMLENTAPESFNIPHYVTMLILKAKKQL